MQQGMNESPFNPLPPVIWILALPIIAGEVVFALGGIGLAGSADGIGMRLAALQMSAYAPEMVQRMWAVGEINWGQLYRIVTYPFVNYSFMQAGFVLAFTLALGNLVARQFRPLAVIALFLGSAIGGALVYTIAMSFLPEPAAPLIGGYPAVYGLVGAFTLLLWARLAAANANRLRAFTLIGMLLLFQLVFGILFGNAGYGWIAEIAGFCFGFGLSFLLVDGGVTRVLRRIRER